MKAGDLDVAWQSLATPDGPNLQAFPLEGEGIWAAVDREGKRHLLLLVPPGTVAPPTTTQGLRVTVSPHKVQGGEAAQYLDLTCLSDDAAATFTAVAADIGAEAVPLTLAERKDSVVSALARWQWFWGIDADKLSAPEILGLFGELWFLDRWAIPNRESVAAWTASAGSRHDFQWISRSVEVKTTARRADGAVLHRIQHLDQLADPEQGVLFLFSLQLVRDQLARNTLPDLVDRISGRLTHDAATRNDFARKLGERGYSPVNKHLYLTPYRILDERLYLVEGSFPRLTRSSFPEGLAPGIADVSYLIDMSACAEWVVASSPDKWLTK